MVFLAALALFELVVATSMFTALARRLSGDASRESRVEYLARFLCVISAMLVAAPVLIELATIDAFTNGHPINVGSFYDYLDIRLITGGAVLGIGAFGYRVYAQSKVKDPAFFSVGANVLGIVFALYFGFVAADQWLFFRHEGGMLNWGVVQKMDGTKITDMHCDQDMIVIEDISKKEGPMVYRCPLMPQIVLGRYTGMPIFAWPAYVEGSSEQLARVIRKMQSDADRGEARAGH